MKFCATIDKVTLITFKVEQNATFLKSSCHALSLIYVTSKDLFDTPRAIAKIPSSGIMAEPNLQEIHDFLFDVALRAGDMITSANPSTVDTKKNCT